MDRVVILKDGRIVKTDFDESKFEFYTTGHLAGFRAKDNNHYRYTIDEEASINGYVDYSKYLSYRTGILKNPNDITIFNNWKSAEVGDELLVTKRILDLTTHQLNFPGNNYKWITFTKKVDDNLIKSNFSSINTEGFDIIEERINDNGAINITAYTYFKNNVINSYMYNKWDYEYAEVIANIAQLINNIEENIFTAFSANDPLFDVVLKEKQQIRWKDIYQDGYNGSSEELKKIYYNNYDDLTRYNEIILNYLEIFKNGKDIERCIAIAASLHPSVLMLIPVTKKLEMIKHICTTYFVNSFANSRTGYVNQYSKEDNSLLFISKETFQNLIVNLTISFDEQSINVDPTLGMSPVNYFMDELLKTIDEGYIFIDHPTIYEVVYKNLNQSLNISEGFIAIANTFFKTNFRANNSKSAFVQAVYLLWLRSKYNPYNENGTLKQNIFYIESLEPISNKPVSNDKFFVEDNAPTVPPSTIFKYSYETAYQFKKETNSVQTTFEYPIRYPDAAPLMMPYESEKKLGIYFDNFSFKFNGNKIEAFHEDLPKLPSDVIDTYVNAYTEALFGTYHIYQPVTLINSNVETKAPIPMMYGTQTEVGNGNLTINSLIPIFVLKMIDDIGDQNDAETVVGYLVDGILTFSGIGNLTKLRHLRWAALGASEEAVGLLTKQGLRVVLGGVEFTSGALGFFANFVECNANDEFCKNVKNFIMLLQLATLSVTAADTVASLALKTSAKRVVENVGGATESEIIQNVKNRLKTLYPNESDALLQEVSSTIYRTSIVLNSGLPVFTIIAVVKKLINIRKFVLRAEYTEEVMKNFINYCKNELKITDDILTEDLLVIANRNGKPISAIDLPKQANYYVNEVVKRGFPAGISSKANYKSFCNGSKNYVIETLGDLDDEFIYFEDKFEFFVKGSSVRAPRTTGDPNINNIELPEWRAGDIETDIMLDENDYRLFIQKMDNYVEELYRNGKIEDYPYDQLKKSLNPNGDFITYESFKYLPANGTNFTTGYRNACKQYTSFPNDKIDFAIVKKNKIINNTREVRGGKIVGKYDMKPKLPYIE